MVVDLEVSHRSRHHAQIYRKSSTCSEQKRSVPHRIYMDRHLAHIDRSLHLWNSTFNEQSLFPPYLDPRLRLVAFSMSIVDQRGL